MSVLPVGETLRVAARSRLGLVSPLKLDMPVISKVDPGFTKTRGIMLSEMNKTKLLIAKQNLLTPANIKDKVFQKYWEKACLEKQFLNMYIAYYQSLFHNSK